MKIEKTFGFAEAVAKKIESFEGDAFHREDIDRIANEVVTELKQYFSVTKETSERKIIVLDLLSQTISEFINQQAYTSDQLAEILSPFVHAVVERIKTLIYIDPVINEDDIVIVEQYLKRRVAKLQGTNRIYKKNLEAPAKIQEMRKIARDALRNCLAKDPCPFIAYPVLESDDIGEVDLLREMDITTLQQYLDEKWINLKEALQVLLDCVNGIIYLDQKGFTLDDLCSENIGVNKKKGGFLFDMCGLLVKKNGFDSAILDFSDVLRQILRVFKGSKKNAKQIKEIDLLINAMAHGKIDLKTTATKLKSIIEQI